MPIFYLKGLEICRRDGFKHKRPGGTKNCGHNVGEKRERPSPEPLQIEDAKKAKKKKRREGKGERVGKGGRRKAGGKKQKGSENLRPGKGEGGKGKEGKR